MKLFATLVVIAIFQVSKGRALALQFKTNSHSTVTSLTQATLGEKSWNGHPSGHEDEHEVGLSVPAV